jgi:hypothetical protein
MRRVEEYLIVNLLPVTDENNVGELTRLVVGEEANLDNLTPVIVHAYEVIQKGVGEILVAVHAYNIA